MLNDDANTVRFQKGNIINVKIYDIGTSVLTNPEKKASATG